MSNAIATEAASPVDDVDQLVASNVRAELARERWTGRKAAAALGVTPTYVSRRLAGVTTLSPGDLQMFADLAKVPVSRFFELPHLDSNQEPIGSWSQPMGELTDLGRERRRRRPAEAESTGGVGSAIVSSIAGRG